MEILLDTSKVVLAELFDCGYYNTERLNIFYSKLADEIIDTTEQRRDMLVNSINKGGMADCLYDLYSLVKASVYRKATEIITEYKEATDKGETTLSYEFSLLNISFITSKDIQVMEEAVEDLWNCEPQVVYTTAKFLNILDITLDFEEDLLTNTISFLRKAILRIGE